MNNEQKFVYIFLQDVCVSKCCSSLFSFYLFPRHARWPPLLPSPYAYGVDDDADEQLLGHVQTRKPTNKTGKRHLGFPIFTVGRMLLPLSLFSFPPLPVADSERKRDAMKKMQRLEETIKQTLESGRGVPTQPNPEKRRQPNARYG